MTLGKHFLNHPGKINKACLKSIPGMFALNDSGADRIFEMIQSPSQPLRGLCIEKCHDFWMDAPSHLLLFPACQRQ